MSKTLNVGLLVDGNSFVKELGEEYAGNWLVPDAQRGFISNFEFLISHRLAKCLRKDMDG